MHYETIGSNGNTKLSVQLETGRMHQIRIQCSSRGHPVLGDVLYGSNQVFGQDFDNERERKIALHAGRLTFQHPKTRDTVSFEAPLPNEWH